MFTSSQQTFCTKNLKSHINFKLIISAELQNCRKQNCRTAELQILQRPMSDALKENLRGK